MNLSASEIRVLGCLLEKQRTTPDQYPLSLNALRLACNQSTNREPVVEYDEAVLRDALHRLERRGYTRYASGAGSRTPKYRHLLAEALPMAEDEQAVMCVLMLRGAQTPGELKQRTERMHAFADLSDVHETLERLIGRELVARLERRPGQKEERYAQLLEDADAQQGSIASGSPISQAVPASSGLSAPAPAPAAWQAPVTVSPAEQGAPAALERLEQRVARLERDLAQLRSALGEPGGSAEPAEDRVAEEAAGADDEPSLAREPAHSGAWPEQTNGTSQS
jgi:uncharacterized protein YceH (UPF0502 family)